MLVLAIAALFLTSSVTALVWDPEETPKAEEAPPHPTSWDPRVAEIAAFVERERRLRFDHPVFVDFLPAPEFEARLRGESQAPDQDADEDEDAEPDEDEAHFAAVLRIAGFVGPDFDFASSASDFVAVGILGQYDSKTDRIVVKGDQTTPAVRATLAHELTHALQDQRFNLKREFDTESASTAFTALVEADAESVQDAYEESLSEAERAEADVEAEAGPSEEDFDEFPPALIESTAFPYVMGPFFLEAVRDVNGQLGVDDAFVNPPDSDADIIYPGRFLQKVPTAPVERPEIREGEDALEDNDFDFGTFALLHLLAGHGPFQPAWEAIKGYENDAGIIFTKDDKTCVRDNVVLDTPTAADAFAAAATAWSKAVPGAKVNRTNVGVELEGCDPGGAAPPTPDQGLLSALVFQASTRTLLEAAVDQGDLTAGQAECIASVATSTLGPERIEELDGLSPEAGLRAGVRAGHAGRARCL